MKFAPIKERLGEYAQWAKSNARTQKGQLRAALTYAKAKGAANFGLRSYWVDVFSNNSKKSLQYTKNMTGLEIAEINASGMYAVKNYATSDYNSSRSSRFTAEERMDKKEAAIAQRAKGAMRSKLIRAYNAEQKKLLNPKVKNASELTQAIEKESASLKRLARISELRKMMGAEQKKTLAFDYGLKPYLLPVSIYDAQWLRNRGAQIDFRGKNATIRHTLKNSYGIHRDPETEWKNGKPISYTRAVHDNYVRSFVIIEDERTATIAVHTQDKKVELPQGYKFAIDASGLKVCSVADNDADYHPTCRELWDLGDGKKIVSLIETNAAKRKKELEDFEREKQELEGVMVCAADSKNGGNCKEGTLSFIQRNSFSADRHYEARFLLPLCKKEPRVRLAIAHAVKRHKKELEQGYSVISDHRLPM